MAIHPRAKAIGLTAPFGSGSTTSAGLLSDRLGFKTARLSSFIRHDFERSNPEVKTEPQ
jgi:dephospho-CoA kinase